MLISKGIIAKARRAGACTKGLEWASTGSHDLAHLVAEHCDWAEWLAVNVELPREMAEYLQAQGCGRSWWRGGRRHRLDGPAIEYPNGGRQWWRGGRRHRLDGPAIEYPDGGRQWWVNGKLHRLHGPAIEWPNGYREWWINGQRQP